MIMIMDQCQHQHHSGDDNGNTITIIGNKGVFRNKDGNFMDDNIDDDEWEHL